MTSLAPARLGLRCILFAGLAVSSLSGQSPALADRLSAHRWEHRVILWHPPEAAAPADEAALLEAQREAWEEYQLAVYLVAGDSARLLFPPAPAATRLTIDRPLRDKLALEPGSSLLLGFDGGVKERQDSPLDWTRYYAAIERMPMRRAEVRREQHREG